MSSVKAAATAQDTFCDWPKWAAKSSTEMRSSGFISMGFLDAVQCRGCSLKLCCFRKTDAHALCLHHERSPHCPVLRPLLARTPLPKPSSPQTRYFTTGFRRRYKSFNTWPRWAAVTPHDLAEMGYIYTGSDDQVQCSTCGIRLRHWPAISDGTEVVISSLLLHGTCPRAAASEVPLTSCELISAVTQLHTCDNDQWLPELQSRLSTFTHWPKAASVSPFELASQGLVYSKEREIISCLKCNVHLHNVSSGCSSHSFHRCTCSSFESVSAWTLFQLLNNLQPLEHRSTRDDSDPNAEEKRTAELVQSVVESAQLSSDECELASGSLRLMLEASGSGREELQKLFTNLLPLSALSVRDTEKDRAVETRCVVCEDEPVEMLFRPCKHACVCRRCSQLLSNCPVCRERCLDCERVYIR